MSTYYILRKANGDILTIDVNGKTHIPVWDSQLGIRRSKLFDPSLVVYVPAVAERRLIMRKFPALNVSFFLLDIEGDSLQVGREISQAELFGGPDLAQAA